MHYIREPFRRKELYNKVSCIAQAMRSRGVIAGDRVVGYMPNMPQTIIAMLAAASIGAIWSSCSPDFGGIFAMVYVIV